MSERDPRPELVDAARLLYSRGWMAGTAGNLSARLADGSFWVSASGRPKGKLGVADFVRIGPAGDLLERGAEDLRPSAESSIHAAIYASFPDARVCYHVHTVESNLASRLAGGEDLDLPPIEMLKGLGVREGNPRVSLALFDNHVAVPDIAADIARRFAAAAPRLPALLVRDHGLVAWGGDADAALAHVELLDYIFRYLVAARS